MTPRLLALLLLLGLCGPVAFAQEAEEPAEGEAAMEEEGEEVAEVVVEEDDGAPYSWKWGDFTLALSAEHRTRYEARAPGYYSGGFNQRPTGQVNMRTVLQFDLTMPYTYAARVELRDARLWGDEPRAASNQTNASALEGLDLHEAWMQTSNLFDADIFFRLGRQELSLGNQRLVSPLNWAPAARSWDGLLWARGFDDGQYTIGGLATVNQQLARAQDTEWLFGLFFNWKPDFLASDDGLTNHEIEVLWLHILRDDESGAGDLRVHVLGLRMDGELDLGDSLDLAYGFEVAQETGTTDPALWGVDGVDDMRIEAYGAVLYVDFLIAVGEMNKLVLGLEYNYASGDSDDTDKRTETFAAPFPFAHAYQGWADAVGWRNLHAYAFKAAFTHQFAEGAIVDSMRLDLNLHAFQRDNDDDDYYGVTGGKVRDGSPDVSDQIGNEMDFRMQLKIDEYVSMEWGWAHFFAGKMIKETTANEPPRGITANDEESDMDFFWLQLRLAIG